MIIMQGDKVWVQRFLIRHYGICAVAPLGKCVRTTQLYNRKSGKLQRAEVERAEL